MSERETFVFNTPIGNLEAVFNNGELKELDITEKKPVRSPHYDYEKLLLHEIREYFAGRLKKFSLPLNPEGTIFQKKVWNQLLKVGFGETLTYSELAARIEKASYARATANALGKNPVIIIIPCHRIVASNGIGGYSCGIDIKVRLLELEKASFKK